MRLSSILPWSRQQLRNITIGIRREGKNRWETRAPIIPAHAKDLQKLSDVKIVAQPCTKRIYTDKEYKEAGVKISEDLSGCDVIVGVKEIPPSAVVPGKVHFCFSHTHKGQPSGRPYLAAFKEKKATLVDYELLTDEDGKRVLAFGRYAGYAGMIDCLHGLGDRILQLGYRTPFLNIGLAHHYPNLAAAKKAVQLVAKEIEKQGLPSDLGPFTFVFTGQGNVSQGAQEIFQLLPNKMVKPEEFSSAAKKTKDSSVLIGTVLDYSDFTTKDKKASIFAKEFAPYTKVLVNGIYWDDSLPRILSKKDLAKGKNPIVIADISCDIDGGVEATSRATTIDSAFMYYNPHTGLSSDHPTGPGDVQLMTIDNLPAQLPRDASTYFSTTLSSIIKSMIKAKKPLPIIERAKIVDGGALVSKFEHLESSIPKSKRVLVLGSGYVCKPAVDYLSKEAGAEIVVASDKLAEAKNITDGLPLAKAVEIKATTDSEQLISLIADSDVVISLLPAALHPNVAKVCIVKSKHLVTGSYISPAMLELDQGAKTAGITVLNEIGLDPGLDHLSAMKMIDEAKSQGDRVESFISWCGGLPAPEAADNPFGYKFSWRPQGVLMATQNPAKYLMRGKIIDIAGKDLLRSAMPIKIHPAFAFEGIPNRNSISYINQYGLDGVHTMFRGTLRYRGFSELLDACVRVGLLDTRPMSPLLKEKQNWLQVIESLVPRVDSNTEVTFAKALGSPSNIQKARRIINALEWLGAMDKSTPFTQAESMMDAFAALLEKKLVYQPGESDMAFMFHELQVVSPSGKKGKLTSTLIQYGDPNGYSAMAKTVGVPVAVAAEMLLNEKILQTGVIAPLLADIYNPMLSTLAGQGISFKEETL